MFRSILRQAYGVFGLLSSPALLAWLIAGWICFYVLLSIWKTEAFALFTDGLRHSILLQVPYVLFLLSGYLNLAKSSRRLLRQGMLRLSVLIFPLGIIIFLTGIFLSLSTREFDWFVVAEGHAAQTHWDRASYQVTAIDDGLKDRFLDVDIGGKTGTGLFKYEPRITLQDGASRNYGVGAFPPTRIKGAYFHILNFGLAPGMRLSENGQVKDEGYVPLKIITPGSSDYFEIPPYSYRFVVSLQPEKIYQKGSVTASEFNLKAPTYKIKVFEGGKVLAEDVSKSGISFGSFSLEFHEPTTWVQLEAVEDPGVMVVLAGIILVTIGVPVAVFAALASLVLRRGASMQ